LSDASSKERTLNVLPEGWQTLPPSTASIKPRPILLVRQGNYNLAVGFFHMMRVVTDLASAGSIIEAGSDTTRNQINIMLAAAAKYPTWVATAQKQLDEVCGHASRLPSFDVSRFPCRPKDLC
jgi:hypothetical protein